MATIIRPAPEADIRLILDNLRQTIHSSGFTNEKILLTGGTGFFGKWLTQALMAMNDKWNLQNEITLLTRSKDHALANLPWLVRRTDFQFIEGDIRTFTTKTHYTTILHGATAASLTLNNSHPEEMFDTVVDGTRNILRLAEKSSPRRLQFISSGAIYGRQPLDVDFINEDYLGAPNPLAPGTAYGEGKRAAELLCASSARHNGYHLSIPRCFAFIGPYLPLDTHFAAGNFIRDAIANKPIAIDGDGTPLRSYLYAADLVIWLITLLLKGRPGQAYNVGSDQKVSIRELAEYVDKIYVELQPTRASIKNRIRIAKLADPLKTPERYTCSIDKAKAHLDLSVITSLEDSIRKTLTWLA